tara:strand:+ start:5770 stop:6528 length:759 start_codon:yes stop_codon:yes gene_type:complete
MTEPPIIVAPGLNDYTVRMPGAGRKEIPADWVLVPPGDPALTRRIKAGGDCWVVQEKKGKRTFSRGIWVASARAEQIRADLENERKNPAYQKKQEAAAVRREKAQNSYVGEFADAVRKFLDFPLQYHDMAEQLTRLVTTHATPVGSGTVARTQRIPIAKRAESAVIAWLRHQTTAYDNMHIARVKGRRRETRRMLAERSRELLDEYRAGRADDLRACPLRQALDKLASSAAGRPAATSRPASPTDQAAQADT